MPESDPYRIFVSHAWEVHDDYLRLFDYLGDAKSFYYDNLSKPEDPAPHGRLATEEALTRQIAPAEVVLVLGGLYEAHTELLLLEMGIARKHGKPTIALFPFGSHKMPREIEQRATEVVIWNERTIVDAIKKHARGEQTDRFEVIDFP